MGWLADADEEAKEDEEADEESVQGGKMGIVWNAGGSAGLGYSGDGTGLERSAMQTHIHVNTVDGDNGHDKGPEEEFERSQRGRDGGDSIVPPPRPRRSGGRSGEQRYLHQVEGGGGAAKYEFLLGEGERGGVHEVVEDWGGRGEGRAGDGGEVREWIEQVCVGGLEDDEEMEDQKLEEISAFLMKWQVLLLLLLQRLLLLRTPLIVLIHEYYQYY